LACSFQTPYFLTDDIYPTSTIFVKTISEAQGRKATAYAKSQEAVRKDVERMFGAIKARFHVMDRPCRMWDHGTIVCVLTACIILHNMVVENERETVEPCAIGCGHFEEDGSDSDDSDDGSDLFDRFLRMKKSAASEAKYIKLRSALVLDITSA